MNTLGGKTQRTIKKEESYSINEGFVCTEKASAGTMVKLNSDGTVSPVASVDDVPFGTLSCGLLFSFINRSAISTSFICDLSD